MRIRDNEPQEDLGTLLRLSLENDTYTVIQEIDELADRIRNLRCLSEDDWINLYSSVVSLNNAAQFARTNK